MLIGYWLGVLLSALVAGSVFTLLGCKIARLSLPDIPETAHWLLAPALGFAAWTAVAVGCWSVFRLPCLAATLLALAAVALALLLKREANPRMGSLASAGPFFLLSAALGVFPLLAIAPVAREGALFIGVPAYDHMKVALVDGFYRHGFPALNPFGVIEGKAPLLNYYFAWFAVAGMLRNIPTVSGWAADAALTWVTAVSALLAVGGLALCVTSRRSAAYLAILAAFPLGLQEPLSWALGDLFKNTFVEIQRLETWPGQAAWVPQHLSSGVSSVLCLYLLARLLTGGGPRWTQASVLGLTAAAALGSSIYAGGFGLAGGVPLAAVAVVASAGVRSQIRRWGPPLALAVLLAVLVASPVLSPLVRLSAAAPARALAWWIFPVLQDPKASAPTLIILYWAVFLFLQFGFVFLAGWLGLATRRRDPDNRVFVHLSISFILGELLIAQFVHSIIANNDLGWRVVIPAMLLLVLWSGVAVDWLVQRIASGWPQARWALVTLVAMSALAGIGSLSTGQFCLQALVRRRSPAEIALGTAFRRQFTAWREVRAVTAPTDVVAVSPTSFWRVTPYTANAPASLFSDRIVVVSDRVWPPIYSHHIPSESYAAIYNMLNQIFNATPSIEDIRKLASAVDCNAQAVLVTPRDRLWSSDILVRSGLYTLASQADDYRIYLRATRP